MNDSLEAAGIVLSPSVGEVARRGGVAVSTLHLYEAKGLIATRPSAGNQPLYARDVLRRVAFIRVAQHVGIQLADIAAARDTLPASRTPNREYWARLSSTWRVELDERIAQLKKLRNPFDRLFAQGLGAQRLLVKPTGE